MTQFPNEKPILPHDLIALAEEGRFTSLDEALDEAGLSLTRRDFDYSESGRGSGHTGVVIARPKCGTGDHWALDENDHNGGEWFQNPGWDASKNALDHSTCPAPPQAPPPAPGQNPLPGGNPAGNLFSPAPFNRMRMTGREEDKVSPEAATIGLGDSKKIEMSFWDKIGAHAAKDD
jgi:hypothetical protein